MDWKTFIAEMSKALAWPLALIVVSFIFKRSILGLLEGMRLSRITKGNWSADFAAAAKEVRAELPTPVQNTLKPATVDQLSEELVDIAPAAAISQAWNQLETCVAGIAADSNVNQKLLPEVLRALVNKGVIQPSAADSILGLRNMRNLAVHAPPNRLTSEQAREFITMAEAIMWTLGQKPSH
jgi:hypothetical protein